MSKMRSVDRHKFRNNNIGIMDATYHMGLRIAAGGGSKAETPGRLLNWRRLQIISTGISLFSLSLGFMLFGLLIILNQHRANFGDVPGGGSFASIGGVVSVLVGMSFLVTAFLHWRPLAKSGF
jgi:hypothetical protein